MAQTETCYGPFDPVTNVPTIDGIVEPEPALVTDPAGETFEQGYTGGSRMNYLGETGLDNVVFSGVSASAGAAGGYLYLGFILRMLPGFSPGDNIAIVLHTSATASSNPTDTANKRRIDITPVGGWGAGISTDPDDAFTPNPNHVRTNRVVQGTNVTVRKSTGTAWNDPVNAPLHVNLAKFPCKVRSWFFNANDYGFSVEIGIPLTTTDGGADWINFVAGQKFSIYINAAIHDEQLIAVPDPSNPSNTEHVSYQFAFPAPDYTTGNRLFLDDVNSPTDITHADVPNAWLGTAGFAVAACAGVKFQGDAAGIGVIDPANTNGPLLGFLTTLGTPPKNPLSARLVNTDTVNAANNVQVTFRFADWGIPQRAGDNKNGWNAPPAAECSNGNPTGVQNIAANGTATFETDWSLSPTEVADFTANEHQCMVAELSSSSPGAVFVEDSVRRNMDFYAQNLSRKEQDFTIDARYYKPQPHTTVQDILLSTSIRHLVFRGKVDQGVDGSPKLGEFMMVKQPTPMPGGAVTQEAIYIHTAHRRTQWTVHTKGKQYRVWEPIGTFGSLARHVGAATDQFDHTITTTTPRKGTVGPSYFKQVGPNRYLVGAPTGQKVSMRSAMAAGEPADPCARCERDRDSLLTFLRTVETALARLIDSMEKNP